MKLTVLENIKKNTQCSAMRFFSPYSSNHKSDAHMFIQKKQVLLQSVINRITLCHSTTTVFPSEIQVPVISKL